MSAITVSSSASSSTTVHSESEHDQILPLYSERQQLLQQLQQQQQQQQIYTSTQNAFYYGVSSTANPLEDDSESFADDIISTCSSSRISMPMTTTASTTNSTSIHMLHPPLTSILRSSSTASASGNEPMWSNNNNNSSSHHRLSSLDEQQQQLQDHLDGATSETDGYYHSNGRLPLQQQQHHRYPPPLPHISASSSTNTFHSSDSSGHSRNTLVFTAGKRKNPAYLLVVAFCALGMYLYSKSRVTLRNAATQVMRLNEERDRVFAQFQEVERDIWQIQRELLEIHNTIIEGGDGSYSSSSTTTTTAPASGKKRTTSEVIKERDILQEKLRLGNSKIANLQHHLQDISKHDAILKYGSGKIVVQLELEFPPTKDGHGGPNTIILEMAPIELMPHSVYMFLEMVSSQLLDGCSFILNALHVIKAAPLPYDGSSVTAKIKSFSERGLDSVAFQEYNPEFPHDKYTVGFAADGTPSFFINTEDNTDIHFGKPCFAKIVSGLDTVKRLEAAPTRNGIWYLQRIGIKKATVLQ